ncbi:unnamed protein product [Eruca vesicaria subsp. sativa]|uniref:Uncharacterized protein n=1 Tax=Eruca vesicaria subsp. sativa TaxID=29727 RepID=A0ABC8LAE4_ERUVS|nr:unnamed protein product [Eruca vesicaria subsp. sativa]
MSAQEDLLLMTKHQILMENYESLKEDYASLEQRFKHVEQMNETMKTCLQSHNQSKELVEATNPGLLRDLERERDEYKKMVEEIKSESEGMINELRIGNDELLIMLEKEEEEKKMLESKYDELVKRFSEIEKECSCLKSLYDDAKRLNGQGRNNVGLEDEVIVVGENHNVNNNNNTVAGMSVFSLVLVNLCCICYVNKRKRSVLVWIFLLCADAIVLSDESDAENDNPTRESNIKQEGSNGVNSSQVKHSSSSKITHPLSSPSSSSSSSSSDVYLVPLKRSRVDD